MIPSTCRTAVTCVVSLAWCQTRSSVTSVALQSCISFSCMHHTDINGDDDDDDNGRPSSGHGHINSSACHMFTPGWGSAFVSALRNILCQVNKLGLAEICSADMAKWLSSDQTNPVRDGHMAADEIALPLMLNTSF